MKVNQTTSADANLLLQTAVKDAGQKQHKHQQSRQLDDSFSKKTEKSAEYSVEIAPDMMQKAKDADEEIQKMASEIKAALNQLENATGQEDVRMKCLQIAMRIIKGDKVPMADHQYLMKHDPELYAKAITHRMPNENPKEHDRLSEDEKDDPANVADLMQDVSGQPVPDQPDEIE
ncbi:MAG: hypothetical protein FWH25_00080 [Syntrophorhabdaceae bacterium]|nr:hypothetical protein [Syntrophorhabdaceae bacterium]